MSFEGQGHFFTIYFPGFVCFVLYKATISGERLQDHWSSGFYKSYGNSCCLARGKCKVNDLGRVKTDFYDTIVCHKRCKIMSFNFSFESALSPLVDNCKLHDEISTTQVNEILLSDLPGFLVNFVCSKQPCLRNTLFW